MVATRPPIERPPTISFRLPRSGSTTAANAALSSGMRSGSFEPRSRYGKLKRTTSMPRASSAAAVARIAGSSLWPPALCAQMKVTLCTWGGAILVSLRLPMRTPIFLAALLCAAAAQAAPQPPAFRLGDVATPLEYSATLAIDPRQPQFAGELRILIRVNRAAPVLWLNATNLIIDSADFEQGNRK